MSSDTAKKIYKTLDRATVQAAMDEAIKRREAEGINLGGRKYLSVKDRVDIFRRFFGFELAIITEVSCADPLVGKGSPVKAVCHIRDIANNQVLASGTAMEYAGSTTYTTTSPFEIAETSAIGRALAALGLHGGEFASSNEVVVAQAMKSIPSLGAQPVEAGFAKDTEEMLKELKEHLENTHDIAALVHSHELTMKQLDQINPPPQVVEEVNELFRLRVSFLKSKAHREQQENLDG